MRGGEADGDRGIFEHCYRGPWQHIEDSRAAARERFGAPVREDILDGLIFDGPLVVFTLSRRVERFVRGGGVPLHEDGATGVGKLVDGATPGIWSVWEASTGPLSLGEFFWKA